MKKFLLASISCLMLTTTADAVTYTVSGLFDNGARLTGTIDANNGLLQAINIDARGSLPGDNATHWIGSLICTFGGCIPGLTSYAYQARGQDGIFGVSESYNPSTYTYTLNINGGGTLAYFGNWQFILPTNTMIGGFVYDPLCFPNCPFEKDGVLLPTVSGVIQTPLPAALPLFAGGLLLIGWFGHKRRARFRFT